MVKLLTRLIIIVAIVVAIENMAEFYILQKSNTILPVIGIIIVTILALSINIGYWLRVYNNKKLRMMGKMRWKYFNNKLLNKRPRWVLKIFDFGNL